MVGPGSPLPVCWRTVSGRLEQCSRMRIAQWAVYRVAQGCREPSAVRQVRSISGTAHLLQSDGGRRKTRPVSRFQRQQKPNDEATAQLVEPESGAQDPEPEFVKSPEVIRRELVEKYGKKVPEQFIEDMIRESQSFNSNVKSSIREDGTLDMEKFQEDDIKSFVAYVEKCIEDFEAEMEAPEDQESEAGFMSKLATMLDPRNLAQNMDAVTDKLSEHLKPSAGETLVALCKAIGENIKKSNRDIPFELQSRLFNCVLRLPPGDEQDNSLFVAGDLIYATQGLRADAFNEARYINVLLKKGNFVKAEYLWSSRRGKDVKDQRFWEELGIMIFITVKNLRKAEELSREILSKYGYIAPNSVVELVKAYLSQRANKRMALSWVSVLDDLGQQYGFARSYRVVDTEVDLSGAQDDQDGFEMLNTVDSIGFDDIFAVIAAFLSAGEYEVAVSLSSKYIKQVAEVEEFLLFKFTELPESVQAGLYYHAATSPSKSFGEHLRRVLKVSEKSEAELKQMMFKNLLQRKSPFLDAEDFDAELTSEDCYSVIKDFINRGMMQEVNQLLQYMQEVKLAKDRGDTTKYALPPAHSIHYIPILQKLGRHKSKDVVVRAEALLLLMNKCGIRRGRYFHSQFLLTFYRKKEFKFCIEYAKENILDTKLKYKSPILSETLWTIYRDANRTDADRKGVKLSSEDIYQLMSYTLKCYKFTKPTPAGAAVVLDTLMGTRYHTLALTYVWAMRTHDVKLYHADYVKFTDALLEHCKSVDPVLDDGVMARRLEFVQALESMKNRRVLGPKKDRLQMKFQSYSADQVFRHIYDFCILFRDIAPDEIADRVSRLAEEFELEFPDLQSVLAGTDT